MAERSFKQEVQKLRLGAGQEFRGEGILAVTKALLQSGVAYVAGYQGAPISHLMDVLADAGESSVPIAPLSREAATWVPAVEVNGEGIFLQFDEAMVEAWCRRPDVEGLERRFRAAHRQWRHLRNRQPEDAGFPGRSEEHTSALQSHA